MATSLCINNEKKPCPYMEKCYRRNPIHFNEMSHPHLETIVIKQLEGEIQVPEKLDFECSDRSLLLDQLKILQIILRREKAGSDSSIKELNSKISNTNIKVKNENSTMDSQDLKDKVEKHKQIMLQRRENKLKDMDEEAEALFKASNEKKNKDQYKVSKMKEDLDSLKIMEESVEKNCSQDKKRDNSDFQDNERHNKKSKSSHSKHAEMDEKYDYRNSQEQSKEPSSIKTFQSCKSTREKAIKMMKKHGYETLSSLVEPGNFAMKYACSAPYHIFFSTVNRSKETYDQPFSITLPEILDISLGEIVNSLHINFMVDIGWLHVQYMLAEQNTNMSILLGERVDTGPVGSNVTTFYVDMPTKFGCHHTKIMILKYKDDGIRVVVSTANLYMDDWENRTQGVWISPHLPPLSESANSSEGESPTGFKKDLERYLNRYRQPGITEWTCAVRRADFSSVNVFFLASVPGRHTDMEYDSWGHRKLGSILSKHAKLPPDAPQWTLVAQSSSIGSLGPNYESWLQKEITSSMSKENPVGLKSHPNFHFIYPSLNNYKRSFDCRVGSCCLPYSLQTHSKQKWIESYMYQWKAKQTGRDKAMPHIKTYTRISPDLKRIPWFVLTSANLSKAAWGTVGKNSHYIMNYEGGVVFIPSFITGSSTFPIKEEEPGVPVFPIPYDLPLTRYEKNDSPFVMEFFSTE
ncbi:probable tyrosyl-DNA phosphodiesterase isoform X2 [Apis mellifera]|uniref:Probable tyrosyl-DNA phosphodiesterase isoform X2 n=1 Tax=Apis mellifera TaxID=7460 RepID=A0A7M7IP61_APIME|nr:probable tyrosyl-DNA phosphodiesterase isoform X2 [Apis mellifera]|eukprot:XP_016773575.1 probable tyrosyl-DNA phosphodiesterase isoform X2 [Apis mellifera]